MPKAVKTRTTWQQLDDMVLSFMSKLPREQHIDYPPFSFDAVQPGEHGFVDVSLITGLKDTELCRLHLPTRWNGLQHFQLFDGITVYLEAYRWTLNRGGLGSREPYEKGSPTFEYFWDEQGKLYSVWIKFGDANSLWVSIRDGKVSVDKRGRNKELLATVPDDLNNAKEILGRPIPWQINFEVKAREILKVSRIAEIAKVMTTVEPLPEEERVEYSRDEFYPYLEYTLTYEGVEYNLLFTTGKDTQEYQFCVSVQDQFKSHLVELNPNTVGVYLPSDTDAQARFVELVKVDQPSLAKLLERLEEVYRIDEDNSQYGAYDDDQGNPVYSDPLPYPRIYDGVVYRCGDLMEKKTLQYRLKAALAQRGVIRARIVEVSPRRTYIYKPDEEDEVTNQWMKAWGKTFGVSWILGSWPVNREVTQEMLDKASGLVSAIAE